MKEAAQRMRNNGRIVNISSGLVVSSLAGFSLYIASKAAVELIGILSMKRSAIALRSSQHSFALTNPNGYVCKFRRRPASGCALAL